MDFGRILLAGSTLDAGRYIDPGGARDAHGLRHIARMQAAGKHEWHGAIERAQQLPVEAPAKTARPRSLARRERIEDQPIRIVFVEADAREIGALRDRQ